MQNLRDVPYKVKPLTSDGYISTTWANFFKDLFVRAGGKTALSNAELGERLTSDPDSDYTALQSQVTSLSSSVTTLQALVNGLGQEPVP